MRLARWTGDGDVTHIGRVVDDRLEPLAIVDEDRPDRAILELAMAREAAPSSIGPSVAVADVRLLPPVVRPGFIRDFSTFERHVRAIIRGQTGKDLPDEWYGTPLGFFSNPHTIFGPADEIPMPATEQLDYELECAVVIGVDAADISAEDAPSVIAGYTVYNDWSARDIQRHEKRLGGGGPSKSKDFANSIGPWLVTPDELGGRPGRPEATMTARVNGREYSRGELGEMHFSFAELVAYTARDSRIRAGDVIGSGTCSSGCIFEHSLGEERDRFPWLQAGDVVELEIEGIGILANRIGRRRADRSDVARA